MKQENILIIGANGQLGTALQTQYPKSRAVDVSELDITDQTAVDAFDWSNVKIILNAAAYTNVDGAETIEGRIASWQVNAVAVANLVRICQKHNITLVHISSDYVFDGSRQPHREDEPFSPLSAYGSSKAAGDIVLSTLEKHYLLRTTWVIGEGKNFVRTMLGLGEKGISPKVVSDQIGRLTFTSELVRAIDFLLKNEAPFGVYNLTNSGPCYSWADITRTIFELAGYQNLQVTDISTSEYFADKPDSARRPLLSEMSLDKINSLGFESRDWRDDLKNYIKKETTK